jgi:hypothetical protein
LGCRARAESSNRDRDAKFRGASQSFLNGGFSPKAQPQPSHADACG